MIVVKLPSWMMFAVLAPDEDDGEYAGSYFVDILSALGQSADRPAKRLRSAQMMPEKRAVGYSDLKGYAVSGHYVFA